MATNKENSWNKHKAKSNSKSKILGVSWHKKSKKWQAFFKNKYLGLFDVEDDAINAYLREKNLSNPFGV